MDQGRRNQRAGILFAVLVAIVQDFLGQNRQALFKRGHDIRLNLAFVDLDFDGHTLTASC
jgi:hypothetical protein